MAGLDEHFSAICRLPHPNGQREGVYFQATADVLHHIADGTYTPDQYEFTAKIPTSWLTAWFVRRHVRQHLRTWRSVVSGHGAAAVVVGEGQGHGASSAWEVRPVF
mmetsp:Transcript_6799/g.19209  ORF Transcript_6799/g.19209 Transcript_6799/m.19209 type:complete len:106 (+) Transcript_6799:314-631(+)